MAEVLQAEVVGFMCVLGLRGDAGQRGTLTDQAASPSSRSSFWRTSDGSTTGFAR
jgi:hypothetical protein